MKLGLILATRGNPRRAAAVIESARFMASGEHAISFAVALDDDDSASVHFFKGYDASITLSIASRPPGIPACWNRCVDLVEAEAYMAFADDGFVSTVDWDRHVADFIARFPRRELAAFAWTDSANPGQPTILMASREWIALTEGFLDDRFPFWFSDTAFGEVWAFVTGRPLPIVPFLNVTSRAGRFNPRLRDLDFWWEFYAFTRGERLTLADTIRKKLGMSVDLTTLRATVRDCEARDKQGREACRAIAEDASPPTISYLSALSKARALMRERAAA